MLRKRLSSASAVLRSGAACASTLGGHPQVIRPGPCGADERPQLVADDRLGVLEEGPDRGVGGGERRIDGRRDCERGPELLGEPAHLAERPLRGRRARPGAVPRPMSMLSSSPASASNTAPEALTRRRRSPGRRPSSAYQQAVVVDQPLESLPAARGGARDPRQVAVQRLEPAQRRREVLARGRADPCPPRHQQLEVGPRVRVESARDLVGVHVGRVLPTANAAALREHRARPRIDLEEHVLQRGLGPQQRGGVLADQVRVALGRSSRSTTATPSSS